MREPGRVFSRTELCERVWQRDHEYDTRTVEIFITRLRKKVDAGFRSPDPHRALRRLHDPSPRLMPVQPTRHRRSP